MQTVFIQVLFLIGVSSKHPNEEFPAIDVIDLTHPTTAAVVSQYYGAVENRWKICTKCGIPSLGTAMHLDLEISSTAMHPAVIPTEYLLTRLAVIDVSGLVERDPKLVLDLEIALQWMALKTDPTEPTLLLFKFGWKAPQNRERLSGICVCDVPGLSYDLAEYIAVNLTHVVGVATDAPTMESEQTRESSVRTVANILGKSGIYMIENVNIRKTLPERGCMALAMPMKLLQAAYVPSRLTAFCPGRQTPQQVVLSLRSLADSPVSSQVHGRSHNVDLDEILN